MALDRSVQVELPKHGIAYNLNSPRIIQCYLKSSKIKQILRKLAKTA